MTRNNNTTDENDDNYGAIPTQVCLFVSNVDDENQRNLLFSNNTRKSSTEHRHVLLKSWISQLSLVATIFLATLLLLLVITGEISKNYLCGHLLPATASSASMVATVADANPHKNRQQKNDSTEKIDECANAATTVGFCGRTVVSSGTIYEEKYGYSRAIRSGNVIHVSGTIAVGPNGSVMGKGNATEQAEYILNHKIPWALTQLGSSLKEVVRTRIYVTDRKYAIDVAKVHGIVFAQIRPANTLVLAQLIEEEYLVEIEAEAFIGSSSITDNASSIYQPIRYKGWV